MTDYAWQASALVGIVSGILLCFWGYRLLKLSLALIGFVAGAFGGSELGLAIAHNSTGLLLACVIVGAIVGLLLCLWLYFLGVFVIGAMAGVVIAAAVVNGTGYQLQPLLFLILPIVCGIFALVLQKFMVSVCTAVSGAYLLTAGLWEFISGSPSASRVWLYTTANHNASTIGYGALALWILLAVLGIAFQLRRKHQSAEVAVQQP